MIPLESSPTTGLVSNKPTAIEIPLSPASSFQSEEVDYSGEDFDFGDEPPLLLTLASSRIWLLRTGGHLSG